MGDPITRALRSIEKRPHPMPGWVLVRPVEEPKATGSGILLPHGARARGIEVGMVVEVGAGPLEVVLDEGDLVYWPDDKGLSLADYVLLMEGSIIAWEEP